jgi:hypothetical protein
MTGIRVVAAKWHRHIASVIGGSSIPGHGQALSFWLATAGMIFAAWSGANPGCSVAGGRARCSPGVWIAPGGGWRVAALVGMAG